jgi:hypothetical protein
MRALLLLATVAASACSGKGSFELVLALPSDPGLRPTGMTTVTVVLTHPGEQPIATTSVLDGNEFSTGDLEVGTGIRIEVQLRDVSNRLVGVGESAEPIDIVADESVTVTIPVRRPFVYASNGAALFSFDPTLEPTDTQFQGQIMGVAVPQVVVSVGGDRLAVVASESLSVISTDTNEIVGMPIALPGTTQDAAAVPGSNKVAVAYDGGIAIVDLDTRNVVDAPVGAVDRVTVGPGADGRMLAHGLIGRLEPSTSPLDACTGTSSVVTIDVETPAPETMPRTLSEPASDIAAAPENVGLFATLPCSDRVARVDNGMLSDFADLERAAVVAVAGGRVYAAGTRASDTRCKDPSENTVACLATSPKRCPISGLAPPNEVDFVRDGANMVVISVPLAGGMPITIELPARRETIFDALDPANQHAQVLQAFGAVPRDLVALPGGQFVGLVATSNYYIHELEDPGSGIIILPCLDATTADWMLLDLASASVAQRVRTSCALTVGQADIFQDWACDDPPLGESSAFGDYVPRSVGALFGAR